MKKNKQTKIKTFVYILCLFLHRGIKKKKKTPVQLDFPPLYKAKSIALMLR